VANRVHCAGDREGCDLRVARRDAPVLNPFLDKRAQAPVNFSLVRPYFRQSFRRKVAIVHAHHAPAETDCHHVGIGINERFHFLQPRAAARRDLVQNFLDHRRTQAITFQQYLFFTPEVVIKRRLGDFQPIGHVVQRSPRVALFQKQLHCGFKYGFALARGVAAPVRKRLPVRRRNNSVP
jgi:hypothetical protein